MIFESKVNIKKLKVENMSHCAEVKSRAQQSIEKSQGLIKKTTPHPSPGEGVRRTGEGTIKKRSKKLLSL